MPTPAWDDLNIFVSVDDFAIEATVHRQDGDPSTVVGIFDDPYMNAQLGEYELDTSRPRFTCKESDVIGVLRGDMVHINGRVYDVLSSAQPDGIGMAVLELALQEIT